MSQNLNEYGNQFGYPVLLLVPSSASFPGLENLENEWNFISQKFCIIELYLIMSRIGGGLCVYRLVLLIPAAFKFIMREIPANTYWI